MFYVKFPAPLTLENEDGKPIKEKLTLGIFLTFVLGDPQFGADMDAMAICATVRARLRKVMDDKGHGTELPLENEEHALVLRVAERPTAGRPYNPLHAAEFVAMKDAIEDTKKEEPREEAAEPPTEADPS